MQLAPIRNGVLIAVALLATSAWTDPSIRKLDNMGFEQGEVGRPPPGWAGPSILTSDDRPQAGGKSLLLQSDTPTGANFGKGMPAAAFRGQTVRFRAAVRASSSAGAGLWLDVMGPKGKPLVVANTLDRSVRTPDWTFTDIVADVPRDAVWIAFGGVLAGQGTAGFDSASFDVVPASTEPISPEAKAELELVLAVLSTRHIDRDRVDWPTLRAWAKAATAHAQTPAGTYWAIQNIIAALGEKHTGFWPPADPKRPLSHSSRPDALPTSKVLGRRVVELTLPGTGFRRPETLKPYAEVVSAAIRRGRRAGACGWILDLRDDTGGASWMMIEGLTPLLGPPPYGGSRDAYGDLEIFTRKDDGVAPIPSKAFPAPAKSDARLQPVAVLLGPKTTSAGETTALAFQGRRNARSFGAATAGFTTGNTAYTLPDGALLAVTEVRLLDRTGKLVEGPLQPDEPTPPDRTEAAALAWLASRGCS